MALLTMPALIGPILGPALGGFITTYATWHWIFLINIPIGLVGIALVSLFFENLRAETLDPFDLPGSRSSVSGLAGIRGPRSGQTRALWTPLNRRPPLPGRTVRDGG